MPARILIVALLVGVGLGCSRDSGRARGAGVEPGAPVGQIAFVRDGKLLLIKPDGTGERLLVADVDDRLPFDWSSDGKHIAYTAARQQGGAADLMLVSTDPNAAKPTNLTRLPGGVARSPAFAPDSRAVAFMRDAPAGLYVRKLGAEGEARRLTHDGQIEQVPAWVPDGRGIVYGELVFTDESAVNKFRMELQLAAYDAAATGVAAVSKVPTGDGPADSPAFAPAGARRLLAYRARRGNEEVALLDLGQPGAAERNLTRSPADEHDPRFSPDGKRIAFWRLRAGGQHELCTMTADGAELAVVCSLPATAEPGVAEWSPDARHLAFVTSEALCTVPAGGGEPVRLAKVSNATVRWR
ncbi:MAG TPA: hypothetical protein VEA69_22570 [Tepidisphaeraceae bacterium]|nr:hypothetical protein [Tepidisphaeraceae bacterium]